jgi:hypothetical protein
MAALFTLQNLDVEFGTQPRTPPECKSRKNHHVEALCRTIVAVLHDCSPAGIVPAGHYEHTKLKTSRINEVGHLFDNVL